MSDFKQTVRAVTNTRKKALKEDEKNLGQQVKKMTRDEDRLESLADKIDETSITGSEGMAESTKKLEKESRNVDRWYRTQRQKLQADTSDLRRAFRAKAKAD